MRMKSLSRTMGLPGRGKSLNFRIDSACHHSRVDRKPVVQASFRKAIHAVEVNLLGAGMCDCC